MSDSIVYVNPDATITSNITIAPTGSSTTTITAFSPSASPQSITITNVEQAVTVQTVGIPGPPGQAAPALTVGMSGDQITVNGTITGPHLTGSAGHTPVITMSGDQIEVDGTITGPHLTGPQGPSINPDWDSTSGLSEILNKPTIPSTLAELTGDSTHRVVTDADITNWDGKLSTSITIAGHPTRIR